MKFASLFALVLINNVSAINIANYPSTYQTQGKPQDLAVKKALQEKQIADQNRANAHEIVQKVIQQK